MASMSDLAAAAGTSSGAGPSAGHRVVRGALIVLEGLDRSGKTTQVKLLEQRFVELGKKVKVMRFPGKLPVHRDCSGRFP
jgi:dTMP kinase